MPRTPTTLACGLCAAPAEPADELCAGCAHALATSPCTRVCEVDTAAATCRGCARTLGEIEAWPSLSRAGRLAVLARLRGLGG